MISGLRVKGLMPLAFLAVVAVFSACNPTQEFLESTEKKYDKLGQTTYKVELDSASIHWRKVGSGEKNLVLIQGFGPAPMVQWKKIVEEMHSDYTIYIPDLVYFGESIARYEEYSPRFQASQVYKSLQELHIGKFYVAGLSYGGLVAQLIAHDHPEMTQGLILIDALSAFYDRDYADSIANAYDSPSMREFLIPENGKEMKKLFQASYHKPFWIPGFVLNEPVEHLFEDPGNHRYNLIDYMYRHKDEIVLWDTQYKGPVQIIWGSEDIIIPLSNAYKLQDFYQGSQLKIIKGAGHVPVFEDDEVVADVIDSFIDEDHASIDENKADVREARLNEKK